jgi:orotidine-5'-phosphate decarboxylase
MPTPLTDAARELARARMALALDLDDQVEALRLARALHPWFSVAKVGLELYSEAGPDAVTSLTGAGYRVFADLKLLDIPTTVGRACRVLGSLGASYVTLHARGGEAMLRASVEGLAAGADAAGLARPVALAVTVLTSEAADAEALGARVEAAVAAGCGGLVCAASDLAEVGRRAPDLVRVVPGIRPAGTAAHDQARPATPAEATAAGADLLVVGRAVTGAAVPAEAAAQVAAEVAGALAEGRGPEA